MITIRKISLVVLSLLAILIVLSLSIQMQASASEAPLDPRRLAVEEKTDRLFSVISSSGVPIGGWPFMIADQPVDTIYPALAFNNIDIFEQYMAVWQNDRPGYDDIYGQLISKSGELIGGWRAIAAGQDAERRYPDIAYNPNFNEYLVVWEHEDSSTGAFSIRGQRISMNGDKEGVEIEISESVLRSGFKPVVVHAFSAGIYLVVWENHTQGGLSNDIRAQLVSNTGALLGGNFDIATGTTQYSQELPDVAYNRRMNEYLVVWQRFDKNANAGAGIYDIYAQVVRPDNSFGKTIQIAYYTASCTAPAVATHPTATEKGQYLVVWQQNYTADNRDIMERFVFGDGNAAPADFYISRQNTDEVEPAVAGSESGERFLVNWTNYSSPPVVVSYVRGREISPTGSMGQRQSLLGLGTKRSALAAGPGGDFKVAFDDVFLNTGNRDLLGQLWGNRIYLPALFRH